MEIDSTDSTKNDKRVKSNDMKKPKLNILAFHGYRQNGDAFKGKIGSFRKTVAKYAQLTFLTGPHTVKPDEDDASENEADQRGWWFNGEDLSFSGKRVGGPAIGFTETLKLIEKAFEDHGPFHGLLGFSQGACLVGILSAMQQKGLLPYKFKFAILASGFCSGSLVHKGFYDEGIYIPSLHVFGETDKIIPREMSDTLSNCFEKPTIAEHSGGHYFACSGSLKDKYRDFLADMRYEEFEKSDDAVVVEES